MIRPDISRLTKNRPIYFQIGLLVALSLTAMAFNYTVYEEEKEDYVVVDNKEEELVEVIRTYQKKKPLPKPPVFKITDNFVDPDPVDPEPEPEPVIISVPDPGPIEPGPVGTTTIVPDPEPPVVVPIEPVVDDITFVVVEEMPRFDGCEDQGLSKSDKKACSDKRMLEFIYSKIKYPPIARENGIEGTVVASFVVEKDGSITGLKILRDIGGGCGKEVLRIVKDMPDWIAGKQRGRKVKVQFNLPVKFELD